MKIRACFLFLALLGARVLRADAPPSIPPGFDEKRSVQSTHFILYHEAVYAPVGILNTLEGLRAKLLLDLQPFAPWALTEKITVFVYASADSYVTKTGIPAWSAAAADPDARQIRCYEAPELQRILAHEMAHLFFMPYFKETGATPPSWLNEGLAKTMEWSFGQEKTTGLMNNRIFAKGAASPLPQMMAFDYHHDPASSPAAMGLWYEQSASVTSYLLRRFPQAQFVAFCDALRHGKSADDAMKDAYGFQIPDVSALERLWRESLTQQP